ncbi:MAG: hypothetical protein ACRD8A_07310 [Candidatus Acidiferrales bacterium]
MSKTAMLYSYGVWSIWRQIPMLLKLFFLALSVVGVYTFSMLGITLLQLRSFGKESQREAAMHLRRSLAGAARVRCASVKQLLDATSYVFWLVFFLTLPSVTVILDETRPVFWLIMQELVIRISFAANVFGVFVILHFAQWIVSSRVSSLALSTELETLP